MFYGSTTQTWYSVNFLSNKQIFYVNILASQGAHNIFRERKNYTKLTQNISNGIKWHMEYPAWDEILQSCILTFSLTISYILYLYSWESYNCYDTFPRNSSSRHHKYTTWTTKIIGRAKFWSWGCFNKRVAWFVGTGCPTSVPKK
jgi:hypothetical protein